MRMFLLDCSPGDETRVGDVVRLAAEETHHLCSVLRAESETALRLTDGRGRWFVGRLLRQRADRAEIIIDEVHLSPTALARPWLVIACAVVKGRHMEWALEKAVETGAHRIVPLLTDRGVGVPRPGKRARWAQIVRSAVKQSQRVVVPELVEPMGLDEILNECAGEPVFWGVAPAENDRIATAEPEPVVWYRLPQVWRPAGVDPQALPAAASPSCRRLTFLAGPEGGWSEGELRRLSASDAIPVSLGENILRTETAAVAGLLALQGLRASCLAAQD